MNPKAINARQASRASAEGAVWYALSTPTDWLVYCEMRGYQRFVTPVNGGSMSRFASLDTVRDWLKKHAGTGSFRVLDTADGLE